jgi:hypothetical protein
MADLKTQYREFLKNNPKSKYSYDDWMDKYWEPSKIIKDFDVTKDTSLDDIATWDITLLDGLEEE